MAAQGEPCSLFLFNFHNLGLTFSQFSVHPCQPYVCWVGETRGSLDANPNLNLLFLKKPSSSLPGGLLPSCLTVCMAQRQRTRSRTQTPVHGEPPLTGAWRSRGSEAAARPAAARVWCPLAREATARKFPPSLEACCYSPLVRKRSRRGCPVESHSLGEGAPGGG